MDLLDAYSYMRNVDRRGFPAKEAVLNGLLSRYPLSEDGYVAAAAALFWDNWESLTGLFIRIDTFLRRITLDDPDPAIFTHWAGVRFLLDSQRSKVYERPTSQVWRAWPGATSIWCHTASSSCWNTAPAAATAPRSWKPSRPACWNW